jgi:plastocyanin
LAPLVAAALFGAMAACGDDNPADPGDQPFNGTIQVLNNRFSPSSVTIQVGDSVTWRWGAGGHSVEEGTSLNNPTPLFNSGVKPSGTFGWKFTSAGTVRYFCRPHFASGMKGTIRVENP